MVFPKLMVNPLKTLKEDIPEIQGGETLFRINLQQYYHTYHISQTVYPKYYNKRKTYFYLQQ